MPDPSGSKRLRRFPALVGWLSLAAIVAAAPAVWFPREALASSDLAAGMDLAEQMAAAATARLGDRLERLRDPHVIEASGVDLSLRLDLVEADRSIDPWLDAVPQPTLPEMFEQDGFQLRETPARELSIQRAARSSGYLDLWWMGSVDLGRERSGMLSPDASTAALSAGFDSTVSTSRAVGVAIGLDRKVGDDIGVLTAPSVSGYASLHPSPQSYIDLLGGLAILGRQDAAEDVSDDTLQGSAVGFAALTFGYEHRDGRWMVAPYGRLEASTLQAGLLPGSGNGPSFSRRASIVGGLRADYTLQAGSLLVHPNLRLEVLRDLGRTSAAGSAGFPVTTNGRRFNVTPGLRADFSDDWSARIEHRSAMGPGVRERTLEVKIDGRF